MFKFGGTIVFCFSLVIILTYVVFVINPLDIQHGSPQITPDVVKTEDEQDLSKLLITDLTPKIVKCNFTGTYEVTQDYVTAINGAVCNDFKPRTIIFDNVISVCSKYLDSNQELFLNCSGTDNPVRKCTGVVTVNVAGTRACEYWVSIQKTD